MLLFKSTDTTDHFMQSPGVPRSLGQENLWLIPTHPFSSWWNGDPGPCLRFCSKLLTKLEWELEPPFPCPGFLPIYRCAFFIWAPCAHAPGINSRGSRKYSLHGSRKPLQHPPPPSLPIAIEMSPMWVISEGVKKASSLLLLIHPSVLDTGVPQSESRESQANSFNRMFLRHWQLIKN